MLYKLRQTFLIFTWIGIGIFAGAKVIQWFQAQQVPDTAMTLDGRNIWNFRNFMIEDETKAIVAVFASTECEACHQYIKEIKGIEQAPKIRLAVLLVGSSKAKAESFATKYGLDPKYVVCNAIPSPSGSYPYTVIVYVAKQDGQLYYAHQWPGSQIPPDLHDAFDLIDRNT